MRKTSRIIVPILVAAGLTACLGVHGELRLDLPSLLPLVVVEPGVQVVQNYDQEVFYTDNNYWVRHNDQWYRADDPHGRWVMVERHQAPPAIVRYPPGRYVHYQGERRGENQRHDNGNHGGDQHH